MATVESSPQAANDAIEFQAAWAGGKLPIVLRFQAIGELRSLLKEGERQASGLLFGTRSPLRVRIERAAPMQAECDPRAIGVFRIQAGGWPAANDADLKLLRTCVADVPAPGPFVMIVRTMDQRPWSATLFALSAPETPLLEFPLDEYVLRQGWFSELEPPLPPRLAQKATAAPRRRRWLLPTLAIAGALAGGAAYHWLGPLLPNRNVIDTVEEKPASPPAPVAAAPVLGLHAIHTQQDLDVSWDRNAAVLAGTPVGTLTIRNGPIMRAVQLGGEQLRQGHVVYRPLPGVDLDLQLDVTTPEGQHAVESVQVLGFDTAPGVNAPAAPNPRHAPQKEVDEPARKQRPLQQDADRQAESTVRRRPASQAAVDDVRPSPMPLPPATRRAPIGMVAVDPTPAERVQPVMNREAADELKAAHGKVTISVQVTVDATGRVTSAKVTGATGEPSPSGSYLRMASLTAAKQWRFHPGSLNGKPAASQTTLVFTY